MHILVAVAILLGINVLTILVNYFLTRGDVHDRLKALETRQPTEPSPEEIADMLTPDLHRELRQIVADVEPADAEGHMARYTALHAPGFTSCLLLGFGTRCGFVLSPIGQDVLRILDERQQGAPGSPERTEFLKKRMDETAERIDQRFDRIEDRLTEILDDLKEQVIKANLDAPRPKKARRSRAKAA